MDGSVDYSRETYTRRYRERLHHQKAKQSESTKVWVLSLPSNRLDLRCHSTASVKVDEFFHSSLYFQWCVRRLRKTLGSSFSEDNDKEGWARMVFEYMMAASDRKPFDTYNLTDKQILTDAKDVFGVVDDSLTFPSMKPNGMLEFGMVPHNPKETQKAQGRSGTPAMSCWAHRITRDPDTILETCRNEGLLLNSLPPKRAAMVCNQAGVEGMVTDGVEGHKESAEDTGTQGTAATVALSGDATASANEETPMLESESELATSSTKNPDIIKQIGEIIAGKVTEEAKEKEDPSTSEGAALAGSPLYREGAAVMSYKDVCDEISAAIDVGAPAYNKGDHKGCYGRYREAGEKILENCSLRGIRQELRSAIECADKQSSFTKQAWTMRHAFDAILCGKIDTHDFTDNDKEELAKSATGDDDDDEPAEMGYKEACLEISSAISRGAPIYNEGDHSGCYNVYRQTAERIVEHCSVAVVQQKLRLALYLAEKQPSFTDRAWTMRHSFDAILRGIFVILNGSVENEEEAGPDPSAADGNGTDESKRGMSYEDACREISSAISRGVPLYNDGDHEGCFNAYKQAAEKILEQCKVGSVERGLRLALETASKQASATMRAWTLRHAFDTILRGRIESELGGSVRVRRGGDSPDVSFSGLLGRRGTL